MKIKKILDLSQPIYHNCPGWPTHPLISIELVRSVPINGYNVEFLKMCSHTGTHLDVPFHFFPDGKTIDQFQIDQFQGEAIVVNLLDKRDNESIDVIDFKKIGQKIKSDDIVMFYTGWGRKRGFNNEYYNKWPYLSEEGAKWLAAKEVKGVGTDGMSIGGLEPSKGRPPHIVLLKQNIWILEEMYLPEEILEYERWYLFAFPILLNNCSGAPVRAVACQFME